jgi:hypothetical protein
VTGDRELSRAEESQAIAMIPTLLDELRAVRTELATVLAALPPQFGDRKRAAEILGVDQQTVDAEIKRGNIRARKIGRRVVVDLASLRPHDPAEIAALARESRR